MKHRFHRDARIEVSAAATWYRERSQQAARRFTTAVAEGVRSICQHAETWPLWNRRADVRRRVLRRVPYSIFYVIDHNCVIVIAVAHHKLPPGYWLRRIEKRPAGAARDG